MPPYFTAEEYAHLPEEKLYRDELIRGAVFVREPNPGLQHGSVDAIIGHLLMAYVMPRRLGLVVHNAGFVLERNPDTVCGPDISFIAAHRLLAADLEKTYFEGAPDLAVEVLSPGNTKKDTAWHVDIYLHKGTRLVWVVDRKRRTVTVHRPEGQAETLSTDDQLSGEDVLPGFQCRVADLFSQ